MLGERAQPNEASVNAERERGHKQGLTLEIRGEATNPSIQSFELHALLRQANVHFRSSDQKADGMKPDAEEPLFHRLDFAGAECLFQLAPLATAGSTQADARVVLGQASGLREDGPAPATRPERASPARVSRVARPVRSSPSAGVPRGQAGDPGGSVSSRRDWRATHR